LKFDKYGNSSIISYRADKGEYDFFGELFADGRFEKLAICVFEEDIENPGGRRGLSYNDESVRGNWESY
jgi:hypothetical protein